MPSVLPPTNPTSALPSPTTLKYIKETHEQAPARVDDGLHAFRPPNGATRSPCPALNTLANHSYLPHDGRNITFAKIVSALHDGFGLSRGFAIFMAIGTFTLLRRPSLAPFDLHGAARHEFIEHNASMVHDDAPAGEDYAPAEVNPELLRKFLAKAHPSEAGNGEVITTEDIIEARIEREAASGPVDALHAELGRAEFAMIIEIFGKGKNKEVGRDDMDTILRECRFPDGWAPDHTLHLLEPIARSKQMRQAMEKVRNLGEEMEIEGDGGIIEWLKISVKRLLGQV